jgi:hypothetical protein
MRSPILWLLILCTALLPEPIVWAQEPPQGGPTGEAAPPDHARTIPIFPGATADAATPIAVDALGHLDPAQAAEAARADGGTRVGLLRVGQALYIEATVGAHPVYLELDPGAPLLKLSPEFLRGAGMRVEEVEGEQGRAQLGLLGRLALGGLTLSALTYTTCQGCFIKLSGQQRPVVGKLGASVLGRLRVELDEASGAAQVWRGDGWEERAGDVAPWLRLETTREPFVGRFGQDIRLHTIARSSAPRAARFTVRYQCELPTSRKIALESAARGIDAMGRAHVETQARLGACVQLDTMVGSARW